MKKSLQWLKDKKIAFEFHDYKSQSISEDKLKDWIKQVGWEVLVNKKGTTWKKLDEHIKEKVTNEATAIAVMVKNTSLIKRPVIESNGKIISVGFNAEAFSKNL